MAVKLSQTFTTLDLWDRYVDCEMVSLVTDREGNQIQHLA